jgi:hypothetical protein
MLTLRISTAQTIHTKKQDNFSSMIRFRSKQKIQPGRQQLYEGGLKQQGYEGCTYYAVSFWPHENTWKLLPSSTAQTIHTRKVKHFKCNQILINTKDTTRKAKIV